MISPGPDLLRAFVLGEKWPALCPELSLTLVPSYVKIRGSSCQEPLISFAHDCELSEVKRSQLLSQAGAI